MWKRVHCPCVSGVTERAGPGKRRTKSHGWKTQWRMKWFSLPFSTQRDLVHHFLVLQIQRRRVRFMCLTQTYYFKYRLNFRPGLKSWRSPVIAVYHSTNDSELRLFCSLLLCCSLLYTDGALYSPQSERGAVVFGVQISELSSDSHCTRQLFSVISRRHIGL